MGVSLDIHRSRTLHSRPLKRKAAHAAQPLLNSGELDWCLGYKSRENVSSFSSNQGGPGFHCRYYDVRMRVSGRTSLAFSRMVVIKYVDLKKGRQVSGTTVMLVNCQRHF